MVVLYDSGTYSAPANGAITYDITNRDLDCLNLLQCINADETIYFDTTLQNDAVLRLATSARKFRQEHRASVAKFDAFDRGARNPNSALVVVTSEVPNVRLHLTFLQLKRSSRRVPARERLASQFRRLLPEDEQSQDQTSGEKRLYVRRKGETP
jgi:hypothetical protein